MKLYLENFHNEELQFVQTLEHILRIQWYCKVHNLKLINMCWQDIFTGKNDSYGNNSNEHGELIVNQFENAVHLWEQIDWSTWWFHNNYGGLREWCIDHNYTQFSESHPTTEAQKHFAKSVVQGLAMKILTPDVSSAPDSWANYLKDPYDYRNIFQGGAVMI